MIEIYLLCQTHAYLDRATLSSDKDFYGFQSCQNEGRVASGFAIEIFVMYFAINQDALQTDARLSSDQIAEYQCSPLFHRVAARVFPNNC